MKKKTLFLSLMAALMFSACSQDENTPESNGFDGETTTSYLTVNLVAAPNMGTRANYQDGTATENKVTSVRFYFFDESGNAAPVKQKSGTTGYDSYYDWTVTDDPSTGTDAPNVEKKLAATLIIESPKSAEDKIPASVVAVINPPTIGLPESPSLSDLNEIAADYSTLTDNKFVMSNSVYAKGGAKMEAVDVSEKIFSTRDAALLDPVVIYVERVLAKVSLNIGLTPHTTATNGVIYKTSPDGSYEYNNDEIYVKFLGWNVTATADQSYLMKSINQTWPNELFSASEPWNFDAYFRSFWAINPDNVDYKYGAFNTNAQDHPNTANLIKDFETGEDKKNYTYVQENAAETDAASSKTKTPTQVIIAAQLVDETGNPMEFAEWAGNKYTVEGLKLELADHAPLWKKGMVEEDGVEKEGRVKVEPDDIVIKTAVGSGQAVTEPGRYYVYAQLKDDVFTAGEWFADDHVGDITAADPATPAITLQEANAQLKKAGHAKVWKEGMTYYYFDIKHLGAAGKPGEYGVVRNHLYNATITALSGLGTPVYNPEEVIYPEPVDPDDQYIAAQINILSWRLVPNNIELKW